MNIASIDMGSNTVLLLVCKADTASGRIWDDKNYYESPRIGKGIKPGARIGDQKVELLLNILTDYKKIIDKAQCETVLVNATNAMRIAANSEEIKKLIENKFGWRVNIIPGDKEALFSFWGAASTADTAGNKTVIDIGGGSTEVIYGNDKGVEYKKSFLTGVVSLTEKFANNNPPGSDEIKDMYDFVNELFSELREFVPAGVPTIAVAGTPTTLSCIKQGLKTYKEEAVEGSILKNNEIKSLRKTLEQLTHDKISSSFGDVVKGRVDIILAGTVILDALADILAVPEIIVSSKGIRYGAVVDYIKNNPHQG